MEACSGAIRYLPLRSSQERRLSTGRALLDRASISEIPYFAPVRASSTRNSAGRRLSWQSWRMRCGLRGARSRPALVRRATNSNPISSAWWPAFSPPASAPAIAGKRNGVAQNLPAGTATARRERPTSSIPHAASDPTLATAAPLPPATHRKTTLRRNPIREIHHRPALGQNLTGQQPRHIHLPEPAVHR